MADALLPRRLNPSAVPAVGFRLAIVVSVYDGSSDEVQWPLSDFAVMEATRTWRWVH